MWFPKKESEKLISRLIFLLPRFNNSLCLKNTHCAYHNFLGGHKRQRKKTGISPSSFPFWKNAKVKKVPGNVFVAIFYVLSSFLLGFSLSLLFLSEWHPYNVAVTHSGLFPAKHSRTILFFFFFFSDSGRILFLPSV